MSQNINNSFAYNFVYNSIPTQILAAMRLVLMQHNEWARAHIVSKSADLPDLQYIPARKLKNVDDFVLLFQNFYGFEKSIQFEKLVQDHILISSKLFDDLFKGDTNAVNQDRINWNSNAEETAKFLASINPYWQYDLLLEELLEHNKMVEQEARYRFNKQYEQEIEIYDQIEKESLKFADYITYGILQQFNIR